MDYHSLYQKTVVELKALAKANGVKLPSGANKVSIINILLESQGGEDKRASSEPAKAPAEAPAEAGADQAEKAEMAEKPRRSRAPKARLVKEPAQAPEQTQAEPLTVSAEPAPATVPVPQAAPEWAPAPAPAPQTTQEPDGQNPSPQRGNRRRRVENAQPPQEGDHAQRQPRARQDRTSRGQEERTPRTQPDSRRNSSAGSRRQMDDAARQRGPQQNSRQKNQAEEETSQPRRAKNDNANTPRYRDRVPGYYNAELGTSNSAVETMLQSSDSADGQGVLEIQADGYGFLRAENYLPGEKDIYVSIAQIRRFELRNGDFVCGKTRPQRDGDRYSALFYITSVNGDPPEKAINRPQFEDLVPIYPNERIRLENPQNEKDLAIRAVDLVAPIGKGQRGLIVSQPKAGKTVLLKKIANAITQNYSDIQLIVLLIDERPEEVTDMQRSIDGDVVYSTFDEEPEHHAKVAEMTLERAQRLVEQGKDVVVLLDSITRLARAYNLVIPPTGRSLSGGLDPGALHKPKRFFGAARNIENGGSLTIIATALVETGSRMDDIIYEEFKGTGNMELHLDRKLSERRIFPAIDMLKSGTRRDDLLLTPQEQEGELIMRRLLQGNAQDNAEELIGMLDKSASNAVFIEKLKLVMKSWGKNGYR